jgi:hypothetical protein
MQTLRVTLADLDRHRGVSPCAGAVPGYHAIGAQNERGEVGLLERQPAWKHALWHT